jgi:hypothetical protein
MGPLFQNGGNHPSEMLHLTGPHIDGRRQDLQTLRHGQSVNTLQTIQDMGFIQRFSEVHTGEPVRTFERFLPGNEQVMHAYVGHASMARSIQVRVGAAKMVGK